LEDIEGEKEHREALIYHRDTEGTELRKKLKRDNRSEIRPGAYG
jgi:hypothetical protein